MAESTDSDSSTRLQFERAEYGEGAGEAPADDVLRCSSCQGELSHEYFEANGQPICERCRLDLERAVDAGSPLGRLLRALAAGAVAAALGAAIYYGVVALTGYEIGLIAIVVGYLVGAGVRWGGHARGGRPYQAIAAGLTYLAIVSTYVPFLMGPAPGAQSTPAQPSTPVSRGSSGTPAGSRRVNESVDEFTQRITTELRLSSPRAADAFAEANAARDSGDLPRAERLYREVIQLRPQFDHALRRLCGVLVQEDRRGDALPLCRQAVQQDPSEFNLAALVAALSAHSRDEPAPPGDVAEAMSQANQLLDRTDLNVTTLTRICQSAAVAEALPVVQRCSSRLDEVAPLSLDGAYCGWIAALSAGHFDRADVRLTQARAAGLDDKVYQELAAVTAQARAGPPWRDRLLSIAGTLLLVVALPFLAGVQNIIGIAIIGFAVFQAWTMNRRVPLQFDGPYRIGAGGPAATGRGGTDAV
jgi:tetratricopeptide (TPR) repeat protein